MKEQTPEERLRVYKTLTSGNIHCWSKGKYQPDAGKPIFGNLMELTEKDPYFLAHLVCRSDNSKDLKVLSTIANFHSDADGAPFSRGSKHRKPNLRTVSQAFVQTLDPRMAHRLLWFSFYSDKTGERRLINRPMKTAFIKYLRYRETNPKMLKGAVDKGMKEHIKDMYRILHISPSPDTAKMLRWKQKSGEVEIEKAENPFDGLTPRQVAKKITDENIPLQRAISMIDNMTPVIGKALVKVATPRQLSIYSGTWEELGFFEDEKFVKYYEEALTQVGDETDRVQDITKAEGKARETISKVKSEQRKKTMAHALDEFGIKKVYIFIDLSPSMHHVIPMACKLGSMVAEMIPDPADNLKWGYFAGKGTKLPLPQDFTEDGFHSVIYGTRGGMSTDTLALYQDALDFGADLVVWITDGQHNIGDLPSRLQKYDHHVQNGIIIKAGRYYDYFEQALSDYIGVLSVMDETTLINSGKITEALATAIKGEVAVIEDIMGTELLKLPKWWYQIPAR